MVVVSVCVCRGGGGVTEGESVSVWIGQSSEAVSCQKEETTVKEGWVCRGCIQWQEGRLVLLLLLRGTSYYFTPGREWRKGWGGGGGVLAWWVQAGTVPRLKLREWGLTVWRVPRSALRDRVATADCCVWPTYSSHRRGQNGLDYLSESRWPTWGGVFRKTLGSLSHGAPLGATQQPTSRAGCRDTNRGIHWFQWISLSHARVMSCCCFFFVFCRSNFQTLDCMGMLTNTCFVHAEYHHHHQQQKSYLVWSIYLRCSSGS